MTKYSDEQRALALALLDSNGGNLTGTAKQLGIAVSTLKDWRNGVRQVPGAAEIRTKKRGQIRTLLEDEVLGALRVIPEKREEATYSQLMTGVAIAIDKIEKLDAADQAERALDVRQRLEAIAGVLMRYITDPQLLVQIGQELDAIETTYTASGPVPGGAAAPGGGSTTDGDAVRFADVERASG